MLEIYIIIDSTYDIFEALNKKRSPVSSSKFPRQQVIQKFIKKLICGIKAKIILVTFDVFGKTIAKPKNIEPKL